MFSPLKIEEKIALKKKHSAEMSNLHVKWQY